MKILKLQFLNLNSLSGRWGIDFTCNEYTSSGFFVITGQTGSGKTTILDAICLALYGRTPRLGKITKSSNQIMSRQTGECFSEVVFESQKGRFICHWSQQRARKKASGELQQPRHEIIDADTGKVLTTKVSEIQEIIEEVTGMKYDQFTRSILLAQGSFAAFLQAGPDDRAPILEQITGTDIYSQISIRVHEKYSGEQEILERMKKEIELIQVLSPEEIENIETTLSSLRQQVSLCTKEISETSDALQWLKGIENIREEIDALTRDKQELLILKNEAEPEMQRLASARKAVLYEAVYSNLKEKRAEVISDQKSLEETSQALSKSMMRSVELEEEGRIAYERLLKAEKNQIESFEVIKKIRELIIQINERSRSCSAYEEEEKKIKTEQKEIKKLLDLCLDEIKKVESEKALAKKYIEENSQDSGLNEAYSGLERQIASLEGHYSELNRTGKTLQKISEKISLLSQDVSVTLETVNRYRKDQDAARILVSRLKTSFEETLEGEDLPVLRDRYENLQVRVQKLNNLKKLFSDKRKFTCSIADLKQKEAEISLSLKTLETEHDQLKGKISVQEELLKVKRNAFILAARVRDMEEERRHLVDGSPCPLCGSRTHPFSSGVIPRFDDAEIQVKDEEEIISGLQASLTGIITQIGKRGVELDTNLRAIVSDTKDLTLTDNEIEILIKGLNQDSDQAISEELAIKTLESDEKTLIWCREVIKAASKIESSLKIATEKEKEADKLLSECEKVLTAKQFEYKSLQNEKERLQSEEETLNQKIKGLESDINRDLSQRKIVVSYESNLKAVLLRIRKIRDKYQEEKGKIESCDQRLSGLMTRKADLSGKVDAVDNRIFKISNDISKLYGEITYLSSERKKIFGEKDPDEEDKKLSNEVTTAKSIHSTSITDKSDIQADIKSQRDKISDLDLAINKKKKNLTIKEKEFSERISQSGFLDETNFVSALLPMDALQSLEEKEENLKKQENSINTNLASAHKRLEEESDLALSTQNPDDISRNLLDLEQRRNALNTDIGKYQEKLSRHEEITRLLSTKLESIRSQQKETDRWNRLHELIGSSDGKKFRVFAQGLTFQILLSHANKHLKQMTDRYILVIDPDSPLNMQVIDTWQAGTMRSVKNLSGGEVFLVSLALALGLSGMASMNVRVDSLFLDEGFGTLDEEALETALTTLSGLQQNGKLIGVISHVPALQERIMTRIVIEKQTGGRSIIRGPGIIRNK